MVNSKLFSLTTLFVVGCSGNNIDNRKPISNSQSAASSVPQTECFIGDPESIDGGAHYVECSKWSNNPDAGADCVCDPPYLDIDDTDGIMFCTAGAACSTSDGQSGFAIPRRY